MKISRNDHFGNSVKSISESLPFFSDALGSECDATELVV